MTDALSGAAAIEAAHVSKVYKGAFSKTVQALDDLSIEIPRGQIFGLLGPNGAGKTTLIKIVLGICKPTTGATFIFGQDSRRSSSRLKVGYLPEDHQFPGYLTADAAMNLYGALSGLSASERREKGAEALGRVGLSEWGRVKTRKFSKGMKQRLGIAQAIFHDPDLILLDEPTDGVDPVGRRAIRDLLLELAEKGKTIFINSHLLLEVELICHKVAILNKGKVLRTGTVDELIGKSDEHRLKTSGEPEQALAIVKRVAGDGRITKDGIHFKAPNEADLDKVLAALADAGLTVREVVGVKATLEDIFIDLVEGAGGSAKSDAMGGNHS